MRIRPARTSITESALTLRRQRPKIEQRLFLRLDDFMRFAIPQLTTMVLLVHVGLGCCWHHAHACATLDADADVAAACCGHGGSDHRPHHDHCDHSFADTAPFHGGHDRHEHPCEGDRCTFVRSKPSSEQGLDRDDGSFAALSAVMPHVDRWIYDAAIEVAPLFHEDIPLPLRAHLLFRVLLI